MNRVQKVLLAAFSGFLSLNSWAAFAQETARSEFDCRGFLQALDFSQAVEMSDSTDSTGLIEFGHGSLPASQNAVDINEFLNSASKQKPLQNEFFFDPMLKAPEGQKLISYRCGLFKAEFDSDLSIGIGRIGDNQISDRARIIVVDGAPDLQSQNRRWDLWANFNYNISTLVNSSKRISVTVAGVSDNWISFNHTNFNKIRLWPEGDLKANQAVFVPFSDHLEKLSELLSVAPGKARKDKLPLIILCQPVSCKDMASHFNGIQQSEQPSETDIVETVLEEILTDDSEVNIAENDPSDVFIENRVPELLVCPETPEFSCPEPDESRLLPVLRVQKPNGEEGSLKYDDLGGIDCVMALLADDVFINAPDCTTKQYQNLSDAKQKGNVEIAIERRANNTWVLSAKAKARLNQIDLMLPEGQDGFTCQMQIVYEDSTGAPVTAFFEPTDTKNQTFTVAVERPVRKDENNKFSFSVVVSDVSACGAPGRQFNEIISGPILNVDLADADQISRKLVYVSLANDAALSGFGFEGSAREELGLRVHSAILSAHKRASHLEAGKPWNLSETDLVVLDPVDSAKVLIAASGTELRTKPVESFRADQLDIARSAVQSLFSISVTSLVDSLSPLVEQNRRFDEITVALIAPYNAISIADGVDVCRADIYRSVARELNSISTGPLVKLDVYPIVGLTDDLAPDLNEIEFLSYNTAKPELSSDMVLCRDTQDNVTVKPFFTQNWRTADDITSRFGVALGDEFGAALSNLISNN
jgi:hypothetical protein